MTCATCNAVLTGTARFCASCGAPRPPASDGKIDAQDSRGSGANQEARPSIQVVDPLAMTAPDAFAATANADARGELERALAAYDAKQQASSGTTPGGAAAPKVATQEMEQTPLASPSQVSPKAASHVVPKQQQQPARTAAMPASAHMRGAPIAPPGSAVPGPQARIPLAPGSSGGIPAAAPSGPPGSMMGSGPGAPRMSPVPFPQPIQQPGMQRPALAPGLPVTVTWANGQRYRGTIVQLMGTRVLVVFPDGQQHWVEMNYISPA